MVRGIVFHKHNFELLILSKLHWCFGHGLKIYAYGLDIIRVRRLFFVSFCKLNLAIFLALYILLKIIEGPMLSL